MRAVVCFQDLKTASLHFDRVLPVAFQRMAGTGNDIVTEFPDPVPSRALINIVFDKAADEGSERYTEFGRIIDGWDEFRQDTHAYWRASTKRPDSADYAALEEAYLLNATAPGSKPLRHFFARYAASLGITSPDVLLPTFSGSYPTANEDPVVRLSQVQLVDANRASWEQILALRSDAQARLRLQRLRAFAETNYTGKSISYVEDDLASRIDEYEQARKKHGFEVITGSLSALLDANNLHAAVGATLAAAILGGPLAAMSAAACIELGKFSLEFAKRKRTMVDWATSHPLAYLVETKALADEA